ncbi:MAG: peptidoglycan-binding protein LysM [Roseivivax sp.]|nr:peptidoglycan-binding protein LysM [Roseivivax sp.]
MGLFNFWKKSGKSLVGSGDAAPDAETLKKEVQDLGLKHDDVEISVEGDKVKVSGGAKLSAEEKEKVILAVGNVEGVAEVEADADQAVFHTVEKGDSLWKIAEKTLGSGARYKEIFEANRPMLKDPDKIYPGQVLRIPQGTKA